MREVYLQIFALFAIAMTGMLIALAVGRRAGYLSFRVLAILTYTIIIPISGIVHLLRSPDTQNRGPFDAANSLDPSQIGNVVLVAGCGLAALVIGVLISLPTSRVRRRIAPLTPDDRRVLPFFVATLLPISAWALTKIRDYAAATEVYGGRLISVAGGNARYAFISYWLVWVISLSVIWFALQMRETKPLATALVILTGAAGCAATVNWSGGRSDAVLAALPMALVLLPLFRGVNTTTLALAPVAIAVSFWQVTELTARRLAKDSAGGGGLADFIDWELGRFSMLGWAVQYTEQTGYLQGETMASGGLRLVSGLQKLLGLPSSDFFARAAQRIATEDLDRPAAGRNDYINPSVISEMYLNFGFLGVIAICLAIGFLSGYCDRRLISSQTVIVQVAWAFIGVSVAIGSQFTELTAPLNVILFRGAPLLAVAGLSSFMARSNMSPVAASDAKQLAR